ncbi:MAG TPA: cytochrome c oxidase subunit II [Candidatus Limnocylindria bacterium]|nr:cytochrome c oxidase subunit II [Candidatus Limnocylindria bacterium]
MLSWFPENISTYGAQLDSLFALIYYITGVWFVAAQALLLYFIIRFRRRPGVRASYVRGENAGELAWVMVPVVVVLALDLFIDYRSHPAWALVKEEFPADAIAYGGTAKQFNWAFTHPGVDGKLGSEDDVTLDNELHVPAGKDVQVSINSIDVIHSFFIPTVRVKQDVLPGRTTRVWFNATKPGRYEIPCAELCGFGHYTMRGFLVVHSPEEYEKWTAEQKPTPAA